MKGLFVIAALGLSASALAQDAPQQGEEEMKLPTFESVDANEDSRISPAEVAAVQEHEEIAKEQLEAIAALDFEDADTNRDGYLSRQEYNEAGKDERQS